ncbi:MAG: hypothetical protein LBP53_03580 [Candidatus Peribacteria bacterium]|jgi:hypothetical protein|nr:hypothetical protein [Candidatus Peribacteria bacterium]
MTDEEIKNVEVRQPPTAQGNDWEILETELSALIADEKSGLADLAKFGKNLSSGKEDKATKPLTKQHLHQIKADLQNGGLIDFEGGKRNEQIFGFEVIGNDIKPTLTPHGDVIIPVNFWFNNQRRTKLLVLHITDNNGTNRYQLPNGANRYEIEISKEQFVYELMHDETGFHLKLLT